MKIQCHVDVPKQSKKFQLEGELDVHQVKDLKSALEETLEEGPWTYILEMAGVSYLDSSGLGMLVFLKKEVNRHHGVLKIVGLTESVFNVFKLTKLDEFFGLT